MKTMKNVSILSAVMALGLSGAALAGKPLVTVSGGGTASFDEVPGLESQFAVGATFRDDGSVDGRFVCMITGMVTISGDITDGSVNGDGSVTVSGTALGIDHVPEFFGPFKGCEFEVTLWPGGPGVGAFLYNDCVVPPPGDAETVTSGHIQIKAH